MANDFRSGHNGVYFIAGALVVVAGVLGYFVFGGNPGANRRGPDIKIEAPQPDTPGKTP